jgi:ATP-binding cassette subfamily F protein 3
MDSREILEDALEEFEGTVIAVSHDRYFINRIFDTLWIVENGCVTVFSGKYDDYLALLRAEEKPIQEVEINKTRAAKQAAKERQKRNEEKKAKAKKREIEAQIEDLEKQKATLEQEFADPEIYQNTEKMLKKQEEYNAVTVKLDELMEEWLEET